jgi:adenylyl-sulfate kinase
MHKAAQIFWFTGLSGSGKTTLAEGVRERLKIHGNKVRIIDGDDIRSTRHKHLGFSPSDIKKNNALIADLCAEKRDAYDAIIVPVISPYAESRSIARRILGDGFHEVYISAELPTLENRDPKGLYARARNGEIKNLIGFSPTNIYEPPTNPDITVKTDLQSVNLSIDLLYRFCRQHV